MKTLSLRTIKIRWMAMVLLLVSGCHSSTYYSAKTKNQNRFDGFEKETANHVVDVNDLILLTANLTQLAEERSVLKKTYIQAYQLNNKLGKMQTNLEIEAAMSRIKLASALSSKSDQFFHQLVSTDSATFDQTYIDLIAVKLNELDNLMAQYQEKGANERLKKIYDSSRETLESERADLEKLRGEVSAKLE